MEKLAGELTKIVGDLTDMLGVYTTSLWLCEWPNFEDRKNGAKEQEIFKQDSHYYLDQSYAAECTSEARVL